MRWGRQGGVFFGLGGDFVFGVFYFLAEWQHAKKFVAAGDAAEGGNSQNSPKRGGEAAGQIRGDAFQFEVAADGTMGTQQVSDGSTAGAKALGTMGAAPGNIAEDAGEKVDDIAAMRAAEVSRIKSL